MESKTLEKTSQEQNTKNLQDHTIEEKISRFLERKFRRSRSFKTIIGYKLAINNFCKFLHSKYNLDLNQLLEEIKTNQSDPINTIDEYYTFLTNCPNKTGKIGLSNSAIASYLSVAKQFLNGEGCKIYQEDIRNRFTLPASSTAYEEGLTRHIINRVLRLSNAKLAAVILMICSGGFRVGEIVQLRLSDINFTTNPTKIVIRAETAKTRQTRITHISSESTTALKDFISKTIGVYDGNSTEKYIFLRHHDERIRDYKNRIEHNKLKKKPIVHIQKLLVRCELELKKFGSEEQYARDVSVAVQNLQNQLTRVIEKIPELNVKNDNHRNSIHFHAFRKFFKTQVTDAHQSDFAEALMGHTSVKLLYYRQNDKARSQTYRQIEHAVTIADTEKFDQNITETREENQELRKVVDGFARQMKNMEKQIQETRRI